jgi:hypothetical protein
MRAWQRDSRQKATKVATWSWGWTSVFMFLPFLRLYSSKRKKSMGWYLQLTYEESD